MCHTSEVIGADLVSMFKTFFFVTDVDARMARQYFYASLIFASMAKHTCNEHTFFYLYCLFLSLHLSIFNLSLSLSLYICLFSISLSLLICPSLISLFLIILSLSLFALSFILFLSLHSHSLSSLALSLHH